MKQLFECGHRGLGSHCHRCRQAEDLEALALTSKKANPKVASKLLEEARRLRSPGRSVLPPLTSTAESSTPAGSSRPSDDKASPAGPAR